METDVIRMAVWRNDPATAARIGVEGGERIPRRVIEKPPSAELSEGQTDEAALGPYDLLDPALKLLIEEQVGVAEAERILRNGLRAGLCAAGRERDLRYIEGTHLERIAGLVRRSEHKRRQAAIGPKLGPCAFGRDGDGR